MLITFETYSRKAAIGLLVLGLVLSFMWPYNDVNKCDPYFIVMYVHAAFWVLSLKGYIKMNCTRICVERERVENNFGKTTLSTSDRDLNLDLLVINSPGCCELDHVVTKVSWTSDDGEIRVLILV
ncbi:unnamed protein product, partial [Timema podura]|nr:unnamed protein product [Timema podura]